MPVSSEEWKEVSLALLKHPHDLQSWQNFVHCAESQTELINKTSNHSELHKLRNAYEAFLEKFPSYLHYWMAYALWERRLNHNDKADRIFRRALQWGTHDVALWVTYLKFKIETLTNNVMEIFHLFETARLKVGYHYHSFEFYQLYLAFLNTYADGANMFKRKTLILLRTLLEIPLYNISASFEIISDVLSPAKVTIEDLSSFMAAANLRTFKIQSKNNKKLIHEKLQALLASTYTVNQFKSYELFEYERLITGNGCQGSETISVSRQDAWVNYLTFVECSYPLNYVFQLYERSLLNTGSNVEILLKYFQYCIKNAMFNRARNVARRSLPLFEREEYVRVFIGLVDLEIEVGNVLLAKDLISRYISINSCVPDCIFAKLLHIEALVTCNDADYLCSLVYEIMAATNSPASLEQLCRLSITPTVLKGFLHKFVKTDSGENFCKLAESIDLSTCRLFWETLKDLSDEGELTGLEFPTGYDLS